MQVSVEATTQLERRVTVVVPVEKVEQAYDKRISNLAKTVKVNGYRKGKIPLDRIKQLYGNSARQEALSEVIQSSLYLAINQEKLNPVNVPTVEPKSIIPGQPLEFVATFEVVPEIENVKIEIPAMDKYVANITDTDVDNVLKVLQQQNTKWIKVDRPAQMGDQTVVDFRGSIDGKAFEGGMANDYPIVLGSKTMVEGFEEGLLGTIQGEEKIIQVTFPESYFAKEFAGKTADFEVKVNKISQPQLPDIDDGFIKKMGVKSGTLEDFRVEVSKNLNREKDRIIKARLKKQVFDILIQQNPLEVPKSMIQREAKRIHDELHPHHAGKEHSHTEAEMASFDAAAKQNVILGILVAKILKQENIILDNERVKTHIQTITSIYENPEEVAKWYETNKKARAEMDMLVLEDQLVEKLLEKVSVTEKEISYNELVKMASQ